MLVTAGERIAMALLSMAIHERAATPSPSPAASPESSPRTSTRARASSRSGHSGAGGARRRKIAIVAGYQGVSRKREITTLGRGGSDTTAVAMAAALAADACEIYSDVDGVYTADPNVCPQARLLPSLGYEAMQAMASPAPRCSTRRPWSSRAARGIAIHAARPPTRADVRRS